MNILARCSLYRGEFLRVFAKAPKNYLCHVCLSLRPHATTSLQRTDFHKSFCLSIFRKFVEKLKFHSNLTRTAGTINSYLCMCMIALYDSMCMIARV